MSLNSLPKKFVRNSSLEILKIISILLIVSYHVVNQSGIATFDSVKNDIFFFIVHSGGRFACTIFIMISSWFLVDSSFKANRISKVFITSFIYLLMGIIANLIITDNYSLSNLKVLLVLNSGLWFVNTYILFLLFTPILNFLINKLDRLTLKRLVILLSIPLLLYPTFFNEVVLLKDEIWFFIFVYFFIGYLKKYGLGIFQNNFFNFFLMISTYMFLVVIQITSWVNVHSIIYSYTKFYVDDFRNIPNFVIALSTFMFFKNLKIKDNKLINLIAGTTIDLYSFHQGTMTVILWGYIFHSSNYVNTVFQIQYCLFIIISIMLIGILLGILRIKLLMPLIDKINIYNKVCLLIDEKIANINSQLYK